MSRSGRSAWRKRHSRESARRADPARAAGASTKGRRPRPGSLLASWPRRSPSKVLLESSEARERCYARLSVGRAPHVGRALRFAWTNAQSSTPAVIQTKLGILRIKARRWFVGNERHACVGVAGHLLARGRVVDAGVDAHDGHLQRVLLRRCPDHARRDIAHALAAAVHGNHQDVHILAAALQCRMSARGGRLVDGVDDIDTWVLGQAVLHDCLPVGNIALAIPRADDLWIGLGDTEALQKTTAAEHRDLVAGSTAQQRDLGRLACQAGLRILPNQYPGL